jgi:hypothetical protein
MRTEYQDGSRLFGLTFSGSTPLGIIVLAESGAVQQLG